MSVQVQPGAHGIRAAAVRNARLRRGLLARAARSIGRGLRGTALALAVLLALAYWLSWRLDLAWF